MRIEDVNYLLSNLTRPGRTTKFIIKHIPFFAAAFSTTPLVTLPKPTAGFLRCWDALQVTISGASTNGATALTWTQDGMSSSWALILWQQSAAIVANGIAGIIGSSCAGGAQPWIPPVVVAQEDNLFLSTSFAVSNTMTVQAAYWDIPY